jgi:hypothetical protein
MQLTGTLRKYAPRVVRDWVLKRRQQLEFKQLGRKAPELLWQACAASPVHRVESGNVRIGHRVFVIGGYETIDHVLSVIDVYDLRKGRWTARFPMPAEVPQTHNEFACGEDRYVYSVSGQLGPNCFPAISSCFVLDIESRLWAELPPLPEPRYGAVVKLWNGRLHAVSGSKPDRSTPAVDHWSLGVAGGRALEEHWRQEPRAPMGGPHRASAILQDRLYLLGAQEGDIEPLPGDPQYTCDYNTPLERLYPNCFMIESGADHWTEVAPMPMARTHSESTVTIGDRYAVIVGGNEGRLAVSDLIQVYDALTDQWRIVGRLPYGMKTTAAFYEGWLYTFAGQRGKTLTDLRPYEVLKSVWRARFDPAM